MRFLDNVVDATEYFSGERRGPAGDAAHGLGTMGSGLDALIKLHALYGSDAGMPGGRPHLSHHPRRAYDAASPTWLRRREPFRASTGRSTSRGVSSAAPPEPVDQNRRFRWIRNAVLLTQAPTGTTSLLAGVSSDRAGV